MGRSDKGPTDGAAVRRARAAGTDGRGAVGPSGTAVTRSTTACAPSTNKKKAAAAVAEGRKRERGEGRASDAGEDAAKVSGCGHQEHGESTKHADLKPAGARVPQEAHRRLTWANRQPPKPPPTSRVE